MRNIGLRIQVESVVVLYWNNFQPDLKFIYIYTHFYDRYADDNTLMAESEEELKSPLMKMKEESEKAGLKFNSQKTKITASGPICYCC